MRIAELRKSKGMTQKEIAELLLVSQQCVAGWETGARKPTTDKLPLLARALGCTIDELYEGRVR